MAVQRANKEVPWHPGILSLLVVSIGLAVRVVLTAIAVAGQPRLELALRWSAAALPTCSYIGSMEVLGAKASRARPSKTRIRRGPVAMLY